MKRRERDPYSELGALLWKDLDQLSTSKSNDIEQRIFRKRTNKDLHSSFDFIPTLQRVSCSLDTKDVLRVCGGCF